MKQLSIQVSIMIVLVSTVCCASMSVRVVTFILKSGRAKGLSYCMRKTYERVWIEWFNYVSSGCI